MTSKEYNHIRREPYKKTGRRPYLKITSASQSCIELGPAQPQLVYVFSYTSKAQLMLIKIGPSLGLIKSVFFSWEDGLTKQKNYNSAIVSYLRRKK